MNFWEKQRRSRSKTKSYIFLFTLAVISIIAIIDILFYFLLPKINFLSTMEINDFNLFRLKSMIMISAGTLAIITVAYFVKRVQLSGGGKSVAKMMGARELKGDLTEKELVYRNVVEEISIASGVVVPTIYVLDNELSINAFVAGHDPNDCIICVTKGTLDLLDRDELQAVIAHEYGHIFNGDMLLNMRLISVLFGILVIGELGRLLMRSRGRSSRRNSGGQVALVGFVIFAVGYVGYFFASLIQARISREREYLADSCSVQYTRNPSALVSLFKKIYMQKHRWIGKQNSKQIAHMFFSQGMSLNSFMSTHPPLLARIEHVDPKFDREKFEKSDFKEFQDKQFDERWENIEKSQAKSYLIKKGLAPSLDADENTIVNRIGSVDDGALKNGIDILQNIIPLEMSNFFYKKKDCVLVIYSLFANSKDYEQRQKQYELLGELLTKEEVENIKLIVNHLFKLPSKVRISIIELCVPALRRLNSDQSNEMFANIDKLIKSDNITNVGEFIMLEVLESLLAKEVRKKEYKKGKTLKSNKKELEIVFSFWHLISHNRNSDETGTFDEANNELGINLQKLTKKDISYEKVRSSLESLKFLESSEMERFIKSLVRGILSDNVIRPVELMYLKMVCLVLSVPFPQID
jgi:Zn-dependent protease with chaperone function